MAGGCTAAAAPSSCSLHTSPHFHPDLTLEKLREMQNLAQQKKQASIDAAASASLTPMQSLDFNDAAQFLEFFDFHPIPQGSTSPKAAEAVPAASGGETASKERTSRPRLRGSDGDDEEEGCKAGQKVREESRYYIF